MDALPLWDFQSFLRAGSTFFAAECGAHVGACGILPVREEQAEVTRREDGRDLRAAVVMAIAAGLVLRGGLIAMRHWVGLSTVVHQRSAHGVRRGLARRTLSSAAIRSASRSAGTASRAAH